MIEVINFGEVVQINMAREIEGKAAFWVSAYLVDGLLIDTGCSYTAEELLAYLQDMKLEQVVNTHYHEDHIGGNYLIINNPSIKIYAHKASIPLINRVPDLYPYQERVWGYPVPTLVQPVPDFIETDNFKFEVIETPGHCPGHISLFEPSKGWCFTGDLFSSETPRVARPEEDIKELINSMQKLLALNSEKLIIFTSGRRIVEDGKRALEQCITYLSQLISKSQELYKQGFSISTIRDEIFGGESSRAQRTNGQFSSENLIRSALVSTRNL
jgi:glyoxylase-like metal-dependent hydrolase (beta-lactamase superfamily II)